LSLPFISCDDVYNITGRDRGRVRGGGKRRREEEMER
jgi:hypothetical protein